jgi:probable rRNA maturation factor
MGNIKIYITDEYRRLDFNALRLKRMLRVLCEQFAIKRADISIAIVDDKYIKKVNREFLGKAKVTDVISFDLSDANNVGWHGQKRSMAMFELVINAQEARKQAKKRRHSAEAEFVLYVVHGFLHNVGFNDIKKSGASRMHKMEDEILDEFGYGITYRG